MMEKEYFGLFPKQEIPTCVVLLQVAITFRDPKAGPEGETTS